MATNDPNAWITETIVKLENASDDIINLDVGGVKITAEMGKALLKFFVENKAFLIKLGQSAFTDFLYLLHEGKNEEAFILLSTKMGADEIIAQINNDADFLKEANDQYDKFVTDVINFGKTVLLPIFAKAIIGLII